MIASAPGQGGATWAVLQYILGLRALGCRVLFVEPIGSAALRPEGASFAASENAAYFQAVVRHFGLEGDAALLFADSTETVGVSYVGIQEFAGTADVLLNLSGLLTDAELLERIPIRVYLDLDPAFTQLWQAVEGIDMRFGNHTHFATVGLGIGSPGCSVPLCGLDWITTPQPVVLSLWGASISVEHDALTTIANWRGYGSIHHDGVLYGQKVHSLREF